MAEAGSSELLIATIIRRFLAENFILGSELDLDDTASLVESGVLDSTGVMELVSFLESTFAVSIGEEDIVSDNLDSVSRIVDLVERLGGAPRR